MFYAFDSMAKLGGSSHWERGFFLQSVIFVCSNGTIIKVIDNNRKINVAFKIIVVIKFKA